MKKNLLSLAVAGALLASASVASAATPSTFYVGGGIGFAHMDWNTPSMESGNSYFNKGDTSGYGANIFAGYSFNEYFSLEGGYRYLNDFDAKTWDEYDGETTADFKVHGPEISALLSVPLGTNGTDIFVRGGGMFAFGSYSSKTFAPIVGIGANINFTDNFGMRVGYDRIFNAYEEGSINEDTYNVDFDLDYAYVALKYTFGKPAPAPAPAPAPEPKVVTTSYTLDANTTFGFDSDKVSPEGAAAVGQVIVDAQNANLQFVKYSVIGHSDRIGKPEYNQKLSERRAQAVANELVTRGVQAADITVSGVGSTQPATGSACDGLTGKALTQCVAPDRRVEIKVSGTVTTTEQVAPAADANAPAATDNSAI